METYKVTTKDLKAMNLKLTQLILIESLGYYGFNDVIINKMVHHNIFPNVYFYRSKPYVLRDAIFSAVTIIMENTMLIYDQNEKNEQTINNFNKMLNDESLKLKEDEIKYLEETGITLADYLKSKIEAAEKVIETSKLDSEN